MSKKVLLLALVVYVATSFISYGTFALLGKRASGPSTGGPETGANGEEEASPLARLMINPSEPKDQVCPLNGQLFTKTEKDAWEQRRPLAVMIENTPDSRPQAGFNSADVIFEGPAEGGVTRMVALFLCAAQRNDTTVGPVRSARYYYIQYASGFNEPLYVHVGGSNVLPDDETNALGYLNKIGWQAANDLNQFSIGFPTFVRNYNRIPGKEIATEHTMESSTEKLWEVGADRGWTNMSPDTKLKGKVVPGTNWYDEYKPWKFQTEKPAAGSVSSIAYEFWSGYTDYAVKWEYDSATNTYKRLQAGEPHTDMNDGKQIAVSNVVVLKTTEKGPVNEKKHMIYTTDGTGDALIFQNGQAIEGKWSKKGFGSNVIFTDAKGKEIEFVPGQIWISFMSKTADVTY